ncbi:hypothetical protein LINPERHAP1_LOCUS34373 [Linum perenne]
MPRRTTSFLLRLENPRRTGHPTRTAIYWSTTGYITLLECYMALNRYP